MSFEYFAPIELSPAEIAAATRALANDSYEVLGEAGDSRVTLRFAWRAKRSEWPEDVDIRFGEGIYVAVHSGTRAERAALLRHVESRLRELGYECSFEQE